MKELNGRFIGVSELSDTHKSDENGPEIPPETPSIGPEIDHPPPLWPVSVESAPNRDLRIVLRAGPVAHDWAMALAEHCSLNLSDLVWQSLLRQAESTGFYTRPGPRYPSNNPSRARRRGQVF